VTLHALRHLYASKILACMDLMTVAKLLGHHSAAFTLTQYGHCLLDAGQMALQVNRAFG
jgi:integrase